MVYENNEYGSYLSIGIVDLALNVDIEATTVAFSREHPGTLKSAVTQVVELNTEHCV